MKITLIVIRSKEIQRLAALYEKLGFEFEYHRHGKGPMHYSTVIDGTVFEIYPLLKHQTTPDTSTRLGFEIENLEELFLKLKNEAIEIVKAPTHSTFGFQAVIKDCDGRKIELTEKEKTIL